MNLSCLPVSFFDPIGKGEMTLAEWMEFAAEIGLDGIECSPVLVQPRGKATPAEFRKLAEANGLAVSNYTCYSDFTHPDPAQREREVGLMLDNVRSALEMGSPLCRALTGQRWPEVGIAEGVRWVVDGIRQVAEVAEREGIQLVVENHAKAFVWTYFDFAQRGEVFRQVMEGLRGTSAGVLFDIANPLVVEESTLDLFEQVADQIRAVHVSDVRRPGAFEFVPCGTGVAPIEEVFRRLRARGFDGWVAIEEASRTGKDGFRTAAKLTRAAWERAGA